MSVMKVKFIVSPQTNPDPYWKPLPPLGIAVITAFLREKGFVVEQDDLDIKAIDFDRNSHSPSKKLNMEVFRDAERVKAYLHTGKDHYLDLMVFRMLSWTSYKGFDVVGISMGTRSHQLMPALCLAKKIKEETGATVVIGGRRVFPGILRENDFVDYCFLSDNGENFLKLLDFIKGQEIDLHSISNIMFREKGDVTVTKPYEMDMNNTVFPDYSGLPMELYQYSPYRDLDESFPKKNIQILPSEEPKWLETIKKLIAEAKQEQEGGSDAQ